MHYELYMENEAIIWKLMTIYFILFYAFKWLQKSINCNQEMIKYEIACLHKIINSSLKMFT